MARTVIGRDSEGLVVDILISGETGVVGAGGEATQGPAGPQGPAGAAGPQGVAGPAGPQGIQGVKGDTGNTGPQGIQGPAGGSLPAGLIVMWGGLVANIPAGWVLCNGQNGTPDLRDRFVKGATAEPGTTGGAATHTHAAHTGVINHTHPVTDPGHVHVENSNNATTGGLRGWAAADTSTSTPTATGFSTASATTGVTTNDPAGGVASLTHDSPNTEPPFFALAFIQKV